jgi:peptidoglycan/LPS O-acetylase OafA/YrhL
MTKSSRASVRLPLVDFLRTVSILAVMASHFGLARLVTHVNTVQDFLASPTWNVFARNGPFGVTLFFLISGFVISNSLMTAFSGRLEITPLREFYVRRAARLLPLLLVVVAIGLIVPLCFSIPDPIVHFGFAKRFTPPGVYLSVLTSTFNWYVIVKSVEGRYPGAFWLIFWSLSIEEQFYLFYPLALHALKRTTRVVAGLVFLVILGSLARLAAYALVPRSLEWSLYTSFGAFDQIALGCLLSLLLRSRKRAHPLISLCFVALGGGLMIFTYMKIQLATALARVYGPLLLDLGAFALLLGGLQFSSDWNRWLKAICLPGKLSYGMYLLHIGLLVCAWPLLSQMTIWSGFMSYVVLVVAISYFSHRYFEQPANKWLRDRFITEEGPSPSATECGHGTGRSATIAS